MFIQENAQPFALTAILLQSEICLRKPVKWMLQWIKNMLCSIA